MRREKREETKRRRRRRRRKADCGVDNIVLLCSSRMIKNCLKLRRRKKTRKLRYRYRESIILIGMQKNVLLISSFREEWLLLRTSLPSRTSLMSKP